MAEADEQEIALERARVAMDDIAQHPSWGADAKRHLLEEVKSYADDLLFNVCVSPACPPENGGTRK